MELNFDTGVKTYNLNGKFEVSFNPTDSNFVERLFNTFDELDAKQEKFKDESASGKAVFDLARKMDAEMRMEIDSIFGAPVCEAVFGDVNVYAMADGMPIWANLLLALVDETDSVFAAEKKKTSEKIAKYTSKYRKK